MWMHCEETQVGRLLPDDILHRAHMPIRFPLPEPRVPEGVVKQSLASQVARDEVLFVLGAGEAVLDDLDHEDGAL